MTDRRSIQLIQARFFEAYSDTIPQEGDIACFGIRKELVVANIPPTHEHGHLIKTAYRDGKECKEMTYEITPPQANHRITHLGEASGYRITELYNERLREAGL